MLSKDLYIPIGSLSLEPFNDETRRTWDAPELKEWISLGRPGVIDGTTSSVELTSSNLSENIQASILQHPRVASFAKLFLDQWISLEFRTISTQPLHGTLRVHVLPDDALRLVVDRSNPKLRRARLRLLNQLDCSQAAWDGERSAARDANGITKDIEATAEREQPSLLELFNRIPSPEPSMHAVSNENAQVMERILSSDITGIKTSLYPYQRRSAAVMLQREVVADQVLDPRLLRRTDRDGQTWYYDHIAGVVLRQPRIYPGTPGGILAEQMGAGKTLICLSLILATRDLQHLPPDVYASSEPPTRKRIGSLLDMAAARATRSGLPEKVLVESFAMQDGVELTNCMRAIERNPASYLIFASKPRRVARKSSDWEMAPPKRIWMSGTSLVIVPDNLLEQWQQEVSKHTQGLRIRVLGRKGEIPTAHEMRRLDVLLFSLSRFENLAAPVTRDEEHPLTAVHFRRCIVDEGHQIGSARIGSKRNLLVVLDRLQISNRWIVTGTPSRGLFGVDGDLDAAVIENGDHRRSETTTSELERVDLARIGAIASIYLKARPWANTLHEPGDTVAEWSAYVMQPKHGAKSRGTAECLTVALNSLIIRHQLSEIRDLLPPVEEKVVYIDGSVQDILSLNLFNMVIISNSVQSQRTDMDYFFHPRNRRSLAELVQNLKQATFFGGSFFKRDEVARIVETAEKFMAEKKIPLSSADEALLLDAIRFGQLVQGNQLREAGSRLAQLPLYVTHLPGAAGKGWSLDHNDGDEICTSSEMLFALQKAIKSRANDPLELNTFLNGEVVDLGEHEMNKTLRGLEARRRERGEGRQNLAGNTNVGRSDGGRKPRTADIPLSSPKKAESGKSSMAKPLEDARIISTASAKLSYLLDAVAEHQEREQMIIFYDNEATAWFLAGALEVLQIRHLIYAQSLKSERRAQYVHAFNNSALFRVLLMDISQAAFGLDMRAASRIYFISPVLNPQVEAQAIGRARRISQQKPVSVETLVLRDSIDEVIMERRNKMSQAEHRRCRSILDDRPIENWIKNRTMLPVPAEALGDGPAQMARLKAPHYVFGEDFGRSAHPDEGLLLDEPPPAASGVVGVRGQHGPAARNGAMKRSHEEGPGGGETGSGQGQAKRRPAVRF